MIYNHYFQSGRYPVLIDTQKFFSGGDQVPIGTHNLLSDRYLVPIGSQNFFLPGTRYSSVPVLVKSKIRIITSKAGVKFKHAISQVSKKVITGRAVRWYRKGASRWYSCLIFSKFFSEKGRLDGTTRVSKKKFYA